MMKQITRKSKRLNKKLQTKNALISNLEIPDTNGMYPIHIAIQNNDLGTLEELISKGVSLNKYNRNRDTPLLLAVKENNSQIVEKLLEEGADSNKCDINQNPPLAVATTLEHQECIDLLAEYGTTQKKITSNNTKDLQDNSFEFVNALIKLLQDEITPMININTAKVPIEKILLLLKQHLYLKEISETTTTKLHEDINHRIVQFICLSKDATEITKKDLLNLARKIIVIIQDCKQDLSTNSVWNLNRIESLIEEKIVQSNVDSEKTPTHIFVSGNISKKEKTQTIKEINEDWYSQNGYRNFEEFVRINSSGAGPIKFLKFSTINKENILQKTINHETEPLEVVTIKPLHPTTKEAFLLLISDALKRMEEEYKLLKSNPGEFKLFKQLLSKAQNESKLSLDESLKLDKLLRPGKSNKIHLIHFHHTDAYQSFWHDFTKEAFLTGATIHLFNPLPRSFEKADLIYSGIAIVNNLLDQDVHPDKIILQSYGHGYAISKEVKNQFQKRGIDLTEVNYQHSLFSPTTHPECICNHRKLHIYSNKKQNKKMSEEETQTYEFSKFAKHITTNLARTKHATKSSNLTDVSSENYSLPQLINIFITTAQYFLQKYLNYKNPPLPQERVENILGIVKV